LLDQSVLFLLIFVFFKHFFVVEIFERLTNQCKPTVQMMYKYHLLNSLYNYLELNLITTGTSLI